MNTQTLPAALTLDQLERTSKNWDNRTQTIMLHTGGAGNMWGGYGAGYVITLHGDNSALETGLIEIKGVWKSGYNIARGANGDDRGTVSYWKGVTDLNAADGPADFKITVEGSCDTGDNTLCSILSAKPDWLIK